VDRLLQLENRLRDGLLEKVELEKKVKELERQHKEQGKVLEKMANEEEFQAKMKSLVDELRVWKEKVKRLEMQQEKEEQTRKSQAEKIKQVQEENKKY
jgi:chromosome segregation ATPase